ncbi:MAG TPA: B-box zinc finger protein [Candidatus Acidoferrum sp.]|nr:B-box zinc finger protein [Candidatus Acidoferrum sp.]
MVCPICEKRPAKRFCPAKGEKICAVCCGTEREATIDCPPDCSYLVTAHRYEAEHRKPVSAEEFPYRDVEFPVEFVYERWPIVTGLASTILAFQAQNKELNDGAARLALEALAETYRTLGTGIYYERPPDAPMARALYGQIGGFLQEFRKQQTERAGFPSLKDSEIFRLLVFMLRVCKQETNGRPLSRAFLAFLRERFPLPAAEKDAPRIIVP